MHDNGWPVSRAAYLRLTIHLLCVLSCPIDSAFLRTLPWLIRDFPNTLHESTPACHESDNTQISSQCQGNSGSFYMRCCTKTPKKPQERGQKRQNTGCGRNLAEPVHQPISEWRPGPHESSHLRRATRLEYPTASIQCRIANVSRGAGHCPTDPRALCGKVASRWPRVVFRRKKYVIFRFSC